MLINVSKVKDESETKSNVVIADIKKKTMKNSGKRPTRGLLSFGKV